MRRWFGMLAIMGLCIATAGRGHAGETIQLSIDGQQRSYLLERANASGPRPTIVMLHGANGTSERVAQITGLSQLAPPQGFAVAYPQSRPPVWNRFAPGKESPSAIETFRKTGGVPNDIGFLKRVAADLVQRRVADPARIFLAGHSNGGLMTLTMFCMDSAPFAGIGLITASMTDVTGAECRGVKPLPVVVFNGTADTTVPYGGGGVASIDPRDTRPVFNVWSTRRMLTFFRSLNGCQGDIDRATLPSQRFTIDIERSLKCAGGPVVAYHIVGGTHETTLGASSTGRVLLDFFGDVKR